METSFENLERAHRLIAQERVLRDLKTLARDAEDLMKATAGDLGERAREARARLSKALEAAKATCSDLQAQMVVAAKGADTVIRDNPYQSVGVAFGLGLLIGWWVGRR